MAARCADGGAPPPPASDSTSPRPAAGATSPPPPPPASGRGEGGSAGSAALLCQSPRPSRRTSRTAFSALPPAPDDPLLGFAPYVHAAPRRNSITPDRQRAFIAALAASGIVTQAARTIGASLEALYNLRQQPGAEGFAAAWEAALARGLSRLEDCALERALQGAATPIVSGGQLLGWYHKPDNAMLRFLLQQRLPQRYGQGTGGGGFGGTGGGGGGRPIQPGHPVWEAVKEAVLADLATRKVETRLREALDAEKVKARRLELSEGELLVEVERLEQALEEEAEYITQLRRLLKMDPELEKQDPRGLRRVRRG